MSKTQHKRSYIKKKTLLAQRPEEIRRKEKGKKKKEKRKPLTIHTRTNSVSRPSIEAQPGTRNFFFIIFLFLKEKPFGNS